MLGAALRSLLLLSLLPLLAAHAYCQTASSVTIAPDRATLAIPPAKGDADGLLHVTLNGVDPAAVTLRASPLTLGDSYAFVRFPDSKTDLIGLSDKCQPGKECVVRYEVYDAWATGTYQGTIDAYGPQGKIGTTPIAAVHPVIAFRPVITSDAMRDGRLVFDATDASSFLLSMQNPTGLPPLNLVLSAEPPDPQCQKPDGGSAAVINFAPSQFRLQPGSSQTVIATVAPCLTDPGTSFATLKSADADEPGTWTETVIALTRHQATATRQLWLFGFVVLGAFVSVLLNNIFPVSRIKNELRNDLHRAGEMLSDCANAMPALIDGLGAEATRLRLSLRQISFYNTNKLPATQEAQRSVAALTSAARLAQQISRMRSTVDGAILSIATHATICGKLREAEEALLADDTVAANDRITQAQAKLTDALGDVAQQSLRTSLKTELPRLLSERGKLVDAGQHQAQQAQPDGAAQAAAAAKKLDQPPNRNPRISFIVEQLNRDMSDLQTLPAQEILDIERDYYLAHIWTEYVEDKLKLLEAPALAGQLAAFVDLSNALLECLLRNPQSEHAQVLLDLVRSDTTPDEIAEALARGDARIECDPRPKYLEAVSINFAFTDPLFNDVAAARRLLEYSWHIDDDTSPPPNVERFRHYFRDPANFWRRLCRRWTAAVVRNVTLQVRVPFTDAAIITLPARQVRPRPPDDAGRRFPTMEVASFIVVTSIAVVTTFGAHYAQSVPDTVTWSDLLASFMLGFGLDQLRDTVTPSAPPTGATTQPAAQPAPAAAPHA